MASKSNAQVLACIGSLLLGACSGGERAGEAMAQNVVLITVDTLRADHVGTYGGGVETPNLDRFAAGSVVFERAYAPATLTHPSVSSMLTGLFPLRHGVNGQAGALAVGVITLPSVLQSHDITTGASVANLCKLQTQADTVFSEGWDWTACGMDMERDQYLWDEHVIDEAVRWLEDRKQGRWFLWVHLMDPHAEHRPAPALWDYESRPVSEKLQQYEEFNSWEQERVMPPADRRQHMLDLYAAEVHGVDAQVGRLLDNLDQREDRDRTAVIFSADHGEELYETWSRFDHGLSMTEGVLWIPLLVQAPGHPARRDDQLVELLQVTPTVLDLLGLDPHRRMDGPSLLSEEPSKGFAVSSVGDISMSMRTRDHRYWWRKGPEAYTRPDDSAPWRAEAPWFSDKHSLARYPGPVRTEVEWLDTAGEHADLREELRARLYTYYTSLGTIASPRPIRDADLDAELRKLGYVDGD